MRRLLTIFSLPLAFSSVLLSTLPFASPAQADEPSLNILDMSIGLNRADVAARVAEFQPQARQIRRDCRCEVVMMLALDAQGRVSKCGEIGGQADPGQRYCAAARALQFSGIGQPTMVALGFRRPFGNPVPAITNRSLGACNPGQPRNQACVDNAFDSLGSRLNAVYQRYVIDHPGARGSVSLSLRVDPSGNVLAVQASADPGSRLDGDFMQRLKSEVSAFNFGPAADISQFSRHLNFMAGG